MNAEKIKEQLRESLLAARAIVAKAEEEQRDFTAEERANVKDHLDKAAASKKQLKEQLDDEAIKKTIAGFEAELDGSRKEGDPAGNQTGKTLGELFTTSEEFRAWFKTVAPNGRIPDRAGNLNSPTFLLKHFNMFPQRQKDLIVGTGNVFVQPEWTGIIEPLGRRELMMRDIISVRQTGSDTVEFVKQLTQVTEAAPVPEATDIDDELAVKPQGAMSYDKETATVKTIAVWIPATKRALSDISQLRGMIDQELREALEDELEDQMLNGDGLGENLPGVNNTVGTLTQVFVTDLLTTTRKAITNLLVNGFTRPTAWVFNPLDWETIDLLTMTTGQFYFGGPVSAGVRTLWGVPVVQSFHQPSGAAWLANWSKAVLWDREAATISVSDSHADFFIKNLVAILAEMRAAFGIIRPSAFVEVALAGGG